MPDLLKSLGLDVYALTDADTDEAHTFTTYAGYWAALAEHVREEYGQFPYPGLLEELEDRGLSRLASKKGAGDEGEVRSLLLKRGAASSRCMTSIWTTRSVYGSRTSGHR
jgi:hypothetical protein